MDKLECIKDLMKSCFLPTLLQDLDNVVLNREDFRLYHNSLRHNLPLLYDVVQQNTWVFDGAEEREIQEVHASLVILLCELDASSDAVYIFQNELLRNASRLLETHRRLTTQVEDMIFTHYCSKLNKDSWKKELGAVHGLLRYLQFRYDGHTQMSSKWVTFCLSVGLNIRECHEPLYKQLGIKIFLAMLHHASSAEIRDLNIHSVIYDAVLTDVHFMDNESAVSDIWNCLLRCLDFYPEMNSLQWSRVDDLMEILLRNITLTSNGQISVLLLKFITRLSYFYSANRCEIERTLLDSKADVGGVPNTSHTVYRWAKSILIMFTLESQKLMLNGALCLELLQAMYHCYVLAIVPINVQVLECLLVPFFEKFTPALMEAMQQHHNEDDRIASLIKKCIQTFAAQLKGAPTSSHQLMKLSQAFESLLQAEMFKRIAS